MLGSRSPHDWIVERVRTRRVCPSTFPHSKQLGWRHRGGGGSFEAWAPQTPRLKSTAPSPAVIVIRPTTPPTTPGLCCQRPSRQVVAEHLKYLLRTTYTTAIGIYLAAGAFRVPIQTEPELDREYANLNRTRGHRALRLYKLSVRGRNFLPEPDVNRT